MNWLNKMVYTPYGRGVVVDEIVPNVFRVIIEATGIAEILGVADLFYVPEEKTCRSTLKTSRNRGSRTTGQRSAAQLV